MNSAPLAGRTIAVPETRELEVFASLLERRGARVLRCPLVAIRDAPDPAPVLAWIRKFTAGACADLILLTGEGLRRLLGCIAAHAPELREPFIAQLGRVRKIVRGPKPGRVLRDLGLKPDIVALRPTSEGIIETLRAESLSGRCVGVQLYGSDPDHPLIEFLEHAGATVLAVAPYVYADAAASATVRELLERMAAGEVDAIAFTSKMQVERLFAVGPPELVRAGLARTQVAAVGPVVAKTLRAHGVAASLMPESSFFIKPLTALLEEALGPRA